MMRRKWKQFSRRGSEDGRSKTSATRHSALPPLRSDKQSVDAREANRIVHEQTYLAVPEARCTYIRSMHRSQGLAQQPPSLTSGRC